MTDEHMIQLIREKRFDPAMKSLYAYFPAVKQFVVRNSGTKQEAEDIFQEALVVFCRKLDTKGFVLSSGINTYLYGVSKLLWLDELGKRNRRPAKPGIELRDNMSIPEMERDLEDDRPARLAQKAISQLGQKCRQLLERFYYHKQSMKEIAAALGFRSEKVAKNQKYRCLEKARGYLHK